MNTLADGAMMHEYEILLIIDYIERYLPLPDVYDTLEFESVSYKRWAADEIIRLLCDHPEEDSEFIIRDYSLLMRKLGALALKKKRYSIRRMFTIAADFVDELAKVI